MCTYTFNNDERNERDKPLQCTGLMRFWQRPFGLAAGSHTHTHTNCVSPPAAVGRPGGGEDGSDWKGDGGTDARESTLGAGGVVSLHSTGQVGPVTHFVHSLLL